MGAAGDGADFDFLVDPGELEPDIDANVVLAIPCASAGPALDRVLADFVWTAYPTMDVVRPPLGKSFLDRLVDLNYGPGRDTLPSGHNMTAWLCAFFFVVDKVPRRILVVVWAALISASTLLVRQHYIIDVVVRVPLAFICLYVVDRGLSGQLRTADRRAAS
jgi:membrane-associated phospholipid phosphatase